MSSAARKVLVYGGSGALGNTLVNFLKQKSYWIVSIDLKENENADANILVDVNDSFLQQQAKIEEKLTPLLDNGSKLDAILNVAGGWAGGNASAEKFLVNSDLMWKQSVWSSLISAQLASKYLSETGTLALPGAAAALPDENGTPGMIGYGMAKAAVHHLTKSLAAEKSGLPSQALVAAIAPITLDTPMNRKWMPKSDFGKWTSMDFIAQLFDKWIRNEERPKNGSLVKLSTENSQTTLSFY